MSFLVCNHLELEWRADGFVFIVFRLSCCCNCSMTLPHGAWVGLQCVIVVFSDHTHLRFEWGPCPYF